MCYTYIMKIDPKQDRRCWCSICEISEEPRTPGEECDFSYIDDNTDAAAIARGNAYGLDTGKTKMVADEQKCGYD
jgi:hypothetical protein